MAKKPSSTDAADNVPAAGPAGTKIAVRGPEDGRWRAGFRFGPIELEIDLGDITPDQLAEIKEDPYLAIREVAKEA